MTTFEDKLQASAQRLAEQDNKRMHVPQNPLSQKRSYWGWIATPAAAVAGLFFGMSMHLFMNNEENDTFAQSSDTIRIFQPVHDTLYLTQIVEKEKIIYKPAKEEEQVVSAPIHEDSDLQTCTSIQCDGIDYSFLASSVPFH